MFVVKFGTLGAERREMSLSLGGILPTTTYSLHPHHSTTYERQEQALMTVLVVYMNRQIPCSFARPGYEMR